MSTQPVKVKPSVEVDMNKLMNDDSVYKSFANGVQTQLTLTEGNLIFRAYDKINCVVTLDLSLLKSLHRNIGLAIAGYEQNVGEEIPTVEKIIEKIKSRTNV